MKIIAIDDGGIHESLMIDGGLRKFLIDLKLKSADSLGLKR